jgi:GTPase
MSNDTAGAPKAPLPEAPSAIKSGFVAVVGRPNAGKSTLVNALVGEKVSIVTAVPQTTRNRILGIANRPGAQVVLMDTPGIHKPLSRLNERMMSFVREALEERDVAVLIADASEPFGKGDLYALELLKEYAPKAILALNKIDRVRKPRLLPLIDRYSKLYGFEEIIPVSALRGEGLEELMKAVVALLPEGPQYFPPDIYTDQPERFLAGEIIREKVIRQTRQEMPYVTAVLIDEFEEA